MKRVPKLGIAALCSVSTLSAGMAQNAASTTQQQAERAVETRQGLFHVQAFAFDPVGAMLKGAPFNAAVVLKEAARIEVTASMIPEVFHFDTRNYPVMTKARANIWSNTVDFDKKAKDLQNAVSRLETAAETGDSGATLKAVGIVGKACSSCHESYREK